MKRGWRGWGWRWGGDPDRGAAMTRIDVDLDPSNDENGDPVSDANATLVILATGYRPSLDYLPAAAFERLVLVRPAQPRQQEAHPRTRRSTRRPACPTPEVPTARDLGKVGWWGDGAYEGTRPYAGLQARFRKVFGIEQSDSSQVVREK